MSRSTSLSTLTPKVIVSFIGTWVLALLAANLVPVLIGALVSDLGMSIGAAAGMATAMSLGTAAGIFATNRFVARGDRPKVARIGLAAMILGFGTAAATLAVVPVYAGVVLGGVGSGIVVATATAASSATRDPDKTTSTVMIVNRLTAAALLAVVPFLGNDLRIILLILAGLGVVGLFAASGLPNLPITEDGHAEPNRPFGVLAIALAVIFGLWSMSEDMVYAMTEILATGNVGLSVETSSFLISLNIIGGLAGAIIAPIALKTIGRSWSIFIIVVVSTASKFLLVTTTVPAVYSSAIVVWGVMYGAVLALVFGLAARMDISGRVAALVSGVYITGIALGPVVGGNLFGVLTVLQYGLLVGIPSLVFGVLLLIISRRSGVTERGGDIPEENPVEAALDVAK